MPTTTSTHATRRQQVQAMRAADPRVTATEIARQLGCSRERVRQLLKALGLPLTTPKFDPLCPVCHLPRSAHHEGEVLCRL